MFNDHHLLKHGAEGQGVVTSHNTIARDQFGGELDYSIHVVVRFDDGTETEIVHRWTKRREVGVLSVGDKVPVRYDPKDHSKVVLDVPTLDAQHTEKVAAAEAARRHSDNEKVAKAQAEIEGRVWYSDDPSQQRSDLVAHRYDQRPGLAWTPVGGQLLPVEAAAKAGVGGVTVDGAMSKLIERPAAVAVAYVSGNAAELVPELDSDWFSTHDIRIVQPYGGVRAGVTAPDGESTGLAIATALASLLSGRIVRADAAMTGILTPTGELLAVKGLNEKARAAKRSYTKRLVAPAANGHEGQTNPRQQSPDLELVFVSTAVEALGAALAKRRAKGYVAPQ